MPTIQIRNIPEPVYDEIRRRARVRQQSIQQFMLAEVHRIVQRTDAERLRERIERFKSAAGVELDVERMLADLEADRS